MLDNNSTMIKELFGKRLKEIRKAKKLTQEQLAEYIGVDTSSVSNIENGRYFPSSENMDNILKVLNVTPVEFFCFEHNNDSRQLLDEMVTEMRKNDQLTRLMYKFFISVKY